MVAQSELEAQTIITVDNIIGYENTGLFNGTRYVELYRTANERHKFFISSEFQKGSLMYNDHFYGNIHLKYDLEADEVLLDIGYKYKFPILKLYKERISEFILGGKKFINIGNSGSDITKGFHEILWTSDDLRLLKKHRKKKFRRIFQTQVYFEFEEDNSYYFNYEDRFYPLEKKGDLAKVFPQFKKEINRLYNKKLIKINPDGNFILIFGELQKLMENEKI